MQVTPSPLEHKQNTHTTNPKRWTGNLKKPVCLRGERIAQHRGVGPTLQGAEGFCLCGCYFWPPAGRMARDAVQSGWVPREKLTSLKQDQFKTTEEKGRRGGGLKVAAVKQRLRQCGLCAGGGQTKHPAAADRYAVVLGGRECCRIGTKQVGSVGGSVRGSVRAVRGRRVQTQHGRLWRKG